jgi:4-amino-4-deoxychorismate lyase
MKLVFNGNLVEESDIKLSDLYRALFFGDGIFESIYSNNGGLYLLDLHIKRLNKGMKALGLIFQSERSINNWLNDINGLIKSNPDEQTFRIKILVWRKGKGTYNTSKENQANFLISLEPSAKFIFKHISSYSISNNQDLSSNSYLNLKTISALPYIIGSQEREKQGLEELIIKDKNGNISEAISSNIILIKRDKIAIPKAQSGFVNGCMLDFLLERFKLKDYKIEAVDISMKKLSSYDLMVFTNSFAIQYVVLNKERPDIIDFLSTSIHEMTKWQLQP